MMHASVADVKWNVLLVQRDLALLYAMKLLREGDLIYCYMDSLCVSTAD